MARLDWNEGTPARCACEFCSDNAESPHKLFCTLCEKHCPQTPSIGGGQMFEITMADVFFGLMRWRVHEVRGALEEYGANVAVFLPIILRGDLPRVLREIAAAQALDNQFKSHMNDKP